MQETTTANGPNRQTDWDCVNWRKTNRIVRNLRQRIFRASHNETWACLSRVRRECAPCHSALDTSCKEGRYGRKDLRVTHPTWTRKREGKGAWWESMGRSGGVQGVAMQGPRDKANSHTA